MNVRPVSLAVGVTATAAGLLLALAGGVSVPVSRPIALVAITLVAGGVAVAMLLVRSVQGPSTDALRDPSERPGVRRPGDEIDRNLAQMSVRQLRARTDVLERVETTATALLARRLGCSREQARKYLEAGEWTDDPEVRDFFAEGLDDESLGERLRALVTGESSVYREVGRVTTEIVRFGRGRP
jgi:hypothetical protein